MAKKTAQKKAAGDSELETPIDLEKALAELETLVEELERGDLPLAKALERFERGVALTRDCETALKAAEHKVSVLMNDAGVDSAAEPFGDGAD